jgi:hypothetical protein
MEAGGRSDIRRAAEVGKVTASFSLAVILSDSEGSRMKQSLAKTHLSS